MGTYGQGGVYRRGRVWWINYSAHGQLYRESSNSEVKKDAVSLLKLRLVEADAKIVDSRHPTFALGAAAVRHYYVANNRKSSIDKRLKNLEPYFGKMDMAVIGTTQIEAYQAIRLRKAKPATINRELACLRLMMNRLKKRGVLRAVPPIEMLKEDNIRTGFIDEDQLGLLLPHLPEHVRPIVEFGYITGWRVSEILSRDFAHVGRTSVRLEPGETKNGKGREFPLIPRLVAVIDSQRDRISDRIVRPLFFYKNGNRIKDFRGSWKKAARLAGLDGLLFHDLRRSAVRNLIQAGVDQHTAMKLTGHETDSVFRRYDIIDSDRLLREATKLEIYYEETPTRVSTFAKPSQGERASV